MKTTNNENIENKVQIYHITNTSLEMKSDNPQEVLLDTGASVHIICDKQLFTKLDTSLNKDTSFLEMADGSKNNSVIEGIGTAKIPVTDKTGTNINITLKNALCSNLEQKHLIC